MLQKKKGFTLVEVLVVILISGLVLSMVAGAMIFVTNSSGELIHQAEDIDMAKNIEKYLRNLVDRDLEDIVWTEFEIDIKGNDRENRYFSIDESGNFIDNSGQKIFSDTGLTDFEIKIDNGIIKCYMKFDSKKEFTFTLGIVKQEDNK
jgi:prepilin-type N-terminal cleavage/methylation domain-containing protein